MMRKVQNNIINKKSLLLSIFQLCSSFLLFMDSRSLLNFHDDDGYEMSLSNESVNSEEERYHMVERVEPQCGQPNLHGFRDPGWNINTPERCEG